MSNTRLPAVIDRLLVAVNRGDVDAFLAFFAADGAVDDWGRKFTGAAAIRGWSEREFIGKQVSLKVTGFAQKGDTVSVVTEVGGKGFNGPSRFTFVIDGDKVREMRIAGD